MMRLLEWPWRATPTAPPRTAVCPAQTYAVGWQQPRRYLWLIAAGVPLFVYVVWLAAYATKFGGFWWTVLFLAFVVIPILDNLSGSDVANAPDSVLEQLGNDRFFRWATYLYLPNQYLSLIFACWL